MSKYIMAHKWEIRLLGGSVVVMAVLLFLMAWTAVHNARDARHWQDIATTNMVVKGHQ